MYRASLFNIIEFGTCNRLSNVRQSIILLTENLNYFDNIYVVDILKNLIYNMGIENFETYKEWEAKCNGRKNRKAKR